METDPGALLGYVLLEMGDVDQDIVSEYEGPERDLPDGDIDRWHLIYRSLAGVLRIAGDECAAYGCGLRERALFDEMSKREMARRAA
jgi:hypothetical protein